MTGKRKIFMFVLLLCTLVIGMASQRPVEAKKKVKALTDQKIWNKKRIQATRAEVKYSFYLSKDKKKAWIIKIKPLKRKMKTIKIPPKLKGGEVVCISHDFTTDYEPGECITSVFGGEAEPWYYGKTAQCRYSKSITKMKLPDCVEYIGSGAFGGMTNLKSVRLPAMLKEIESYAFYGSDKLTKVVMNKKLKNFSRESFAFCKKLTDISLDKSNKALTVKDGMLFDKSMKKLIWAAPGIKEIMIPEGTCSIGSNCFSTSCVNKLSIPSSLARVENNGLYVPYLKDLSLNANNNTFEIDGESLFIKNTGELICQLPRNGKTAYVSSKVKKITGNSKCSGDYSTEDGSTIQYLVFLGDIILCKGSNKIITEQHYGYIQLVFLTQKLPLIDKKPKYRDNLLIDKADCIYVPRGSEKNYFNALKKFYTFKSDVVRIKPVTKRIMRKIS